MLITRWIDYGIRVTVALALRPDRWTGAEELAAACDITRPAVLRLVRQLGQAGLVDTRRGPGGGIKLARRPDDISFQDIVLATDKRRAVNPCLIEDHFCDRAPHCAVHRLLEPLQEHVDRFFTTTTVAHLADAQRRLDAAPKGA